MTAVETNNNHTRPATNERKAKRAKIDETAPVSISSMVHFDEEYILDTIRMSHDGELLVCGGDSAVVFVWDVEEKKLSAMKYSSTNLYRLWTFRVTRR